MINFTKQSRELHIKEVINLSHLIIRFSTYKPEQFQFNFQVDKSQKMFDSKTKIVSGSSVPPLYHPHASVGSVMLHCLARNPSGISQINYDDGSKITCGEMRKMGISVAQNLTKFGLKFSDEVGLLVRNSTYVMPVVIGCLTMGLPFCPVDLLSIDDLFEHFIKSVKPKIWFCENDQAETLKKLLKLHKCEVEIVTMGEKIDGHLNIADFLKETGTEHEFM